MDEPTSSTSKASSPTMGEEKKESGAPLPPLPNVKTERRTHTPNGGGRIGRSFSSYGVAQVAAAAEALANGDDDGTTKKFPDGFFERNKIIEGGGGGGANGIPSKLTRSATAAGDMSLHATRAASSNKARRNLSVWDYCCAELGLSVVRIRNAPFSHDTIIITVTHNIILFLPLQSQHH